MGFRKFKARESVLVLEAALHETVVVLVMKMGDHSSGFHAIDGD